MEDLVHIHLDFTVSTENFRFDASVVLPFSKVAGVLKYCGDISSMAEK